MPGAGYLAGYISRYSVRDEMEVLNLAVRRNAAGAGHERRLLFWPLQAGRKIGIQKACLEVCGESNFPPSGLYGRGLVLSNAGKGRIIMQTMKNALLYARVIGDIANRL